MPAIREHDPVLNDMDDDDGMPPLVDNPNPSMTFTFFTDMTSITALSADPTVPFETIWENPVPASPVDFADPPETQATFQGPERASHGKKRDASYIPRPPNAFILFRSSFIRSQQVPEKVEGNHSTLSKIIGKYWKTLPREEREVWEAKALVAQAEHRRRYPDWRFRPGANALAKLKVKDGPQTSTRRRSGQGGRKAKGDSTGKKRKSGDERCAMIADLLVEGKTGVDLEDAVKRWEDSASKEVDGMMNNSNDGERKGGGDEQKEVVVANEFKSHERVISNGATDNASIDPSVSIRADSDGSFAPTQARAQTPDPIPDNRFRIPLTAMFKRSLSAPAAHPSPSPSNQITSHTRHDSFGSVFANITYDAVDSPQSTCTPPSFNGEQQEDLTAVLGESMGNLSPLVLPSVLRDGVPARWNDPYNLLETSIGFPPSTDCPGLTYALDSPSVSPVDQSFGAYGFCSTNAQFDRIIPAGYTQDMQDSYCPSKSWADCVSSYEQMPIFVNEYAGSPTIYDWCTTNSSMYMGCPDTLQHYPGDASHFGGHEVIRVHTEGGYLPTIAY